MNPVELRNYVSVKSCCLSTKGLSLLNKMRGGQIDPCCMTKHVTARTSSDLMSGAYVQDVWWKVTFKVSVRYISASPITWSYLNTTNGAGEVIEHCRVPGYETFTLPASLLSSGQGFELAQILTELFNQGSNDELNLIITATNTTVAEDDPDSGTMEIVFFMNDSYIDSEGNPIGAVSLDLTYTNMLFIVDSIDISPATTHSYECLTSSEVCDLAGFIDTYCDSCNEYEPETVTE